MPIRSNAWFPAFRFTRGNEFEKWWLLALLWWDYFVLYIHRNDIYFVFPLLKSELAFSAFQLGLVGTVFQWGYALVSPFVGYLGDRFDRCAILIWSALLSTLVTLGIGLSHSPEQIIVLRVLLAVTQAASVPAAAGLIADLHPSKTRSTAVGIYLTSPFSGLLASGVIGGYVAQHYGWRRSFFVFAALGLLMTLALVLFLKRRGRSASTTPSAESPPARDLWPVIREVLSAKTCVALGTVSVLDGIVRLTVITWLPAFFFERFSMNLTKAGAFSTQFIQPASMLGVLVGGKLGDWSAEKNIRGRLFIQSAGLMGMAPALYLMGFSSSVSAISIAMLFYGFALGLNLANLWPSTFQVLSPTSRSTAVGLFNFAGSVIGGWVPAAVGAATASVRLGTIIGTLSLVSMVSSLICIVTALRFLPKEAARLRKES
jgi:MFS family permease